MRDEEVVYICPNLECGCEVIEGVIIPVPMRCPDCGTIMMKKVRVNTIKK
jgi:DNA-directed RNA polymerase subunit RPC12/RpoP